MKRFRLLSYSVKRLASPAFTIIELLIVVVIIGILASITITSYSNITQRANAAALQSDLINDKKILSMYQATYGGYPASLDANNCPVANASGTLPADNNYCLKTSSGNTLTYQPLVGSINNFTLYDKNNSSGLVYVTNDTISPKATALSTPCPSGLIPVPGSPTYATSDFCVAKYEAKCASTADLTTGLTTPNTGANTYDNSIAATACTAANSRAVVSVASGYPIANINQTDSMTYSTNACSGCHLITEAQWMTLAQNVLSVPSNWSGGAVGSGYIYSGHNDNAPGTALTADTNDTNGYYGETNTGGNQKRTLTLTNGQVIWDLAGDVWEWTQGTTTGGQPGASTNTGFQWTEWPNVNVTGSLAVNPFPSGTGLTGAGTWNSSNGIGQLLSYTADATLRGFVRGANWLYGSNAGVLALILNFAPGGTDHSIGLRVSR